jgi:uncharacterized membrane protein
MFRSLNYNSKYLYWITILGLAFFNIIQKISFLDAEPFWYDEIVSIKASLLDFGHIKHMSEWDNNPPFYYYSLWVWLKIVGISEFKARLLSVLFSAASACLIFTISKKYFNYKTALGAALIFSMHNFVYAYSYEARCYSLVVLLVLISSSLFLKLLKQKNTSTIIFLGLANFLIVYTHYLAGMVLFFQLTLILLIKRDLISPYFISIGICLVLVLIRFTKKQVLLVLAYEKGAETFWLKTANVDSLYASVINLFSGIYVWPLLLILFLAAIARMICIRKTINTSQINNLIYFFILGGLSVLILFTIGTFIPIFLDRYLLFTTPFIAISISWLLFNSRPLVQFLMIPILCLQVLSLNLNPQKNMDFRLAANVVKELRQSSNAMVILQTKDITGLFTYYYSRDLFMDQKNLTKNLSRNRVTEIENYNNLRTLPFKDENTIIFCQTFEKADDSRQIFDIFKKNNFIFTTTKSVKGVKISLLKKIKPLYEK